MRKSLIIILVSNVGVCISHKHTSTNLIEMSCRNTTKMRAESNLLRTWDNLKTDGIHCQYNTVQGFIMLAVIFITCNVVVLHDASPIKIINMQNCYDFT